MKTLHVDRITRTKSAVAGISSIGGTDENGNVWQHPRAYVNRKDRNCEYLVNGIAVSGIDGAVLIAKHDRKPIDMTGITSKYA